MKARESSRPGGDGWHDHHHHVRPGRSTSRPLHGADQREQLPRCTSAATALADGPVGRVGLEIEAHCFDLADPHAPPRLGRADRRHRGRARRCPAAALITVEPGGAVELSGPPCDGPLPAIAAMAADRAVLRAAFAEAGLGPGAARRRPAAARRSGSTRATATARWSSSSPPVGTGAAGAAMMTSTASVQVNLEAGPRGGWAARVRLAHALGPTMIAIAANSPLLGGKFTGWRSRGSGCGASSTRRAAVRSSAPAVTTRPATGRATR